MKIIDLHRARNTPLKLIGSAVLSMVFSGTAMAGQLIYTPVNPSFGGNPFNGPYLMGVAQQAASEKAPNPLGDAFTDLTGTLDNICTAVSCSDPAASTATDTGNGAGAGASADGGVNNTMQAPINSGVLR